MSVYVRNARMGVMGVIIALILAGAADASELSGVRVCADPDNLPFSSRDSTTPGFEVELARQVAADVSFYWVPTYRWIFVARQLLDKRCDLVFGLPLDPRFTDENPRIVLSRPYYVMGQVLVSRADERIRRLEDLKGKVVAVQAMTPGDILAFQRGYPRRINLTPEETFRAVLSGDADGAVMWSSFAGWLAKRTPGVELNWIHDPESEFKVAIGVRKADGQLKTALDRILMRLLDEKKVEHILGRYGVPVFRAR